VTTQKSVSRVGTDIPYGIFSRLFCVVTDIPDGISDGIFSRLS
jgi:hypothetical protein